MVIFLRRTAVIIGAGPAGLTAAYELLLQTDIVPVIYEKTGDIGGISKTVAYKGNRIDIGGHRFFSKSDRVMDWWTRVLPVQAQASALSGVHIQYQNQTRDLAGVQTSDTDSDEVMLVRRRLSRIYFLKTLFAYPISLSVDTLRKLGVFRTIAIGVSYFRSLLFPIRPETHLEAFFINRFGRVLYRLFFKDYTEKVWGLACTQIDASWGAQRIKGLSIKAALRHAWKKIRGVGSDLRQKETETSLIEQFLYPKLGPGQLWEVVARQIQEKGGILHLNCDITRLFWEGNRIVSVQVQDQTTGGWERVDADFVFSTMPIRELVAGFFPELEPEVLSLAQGLLYRDFVTVGVLLDRQKVPPEFKSMLDNWIYIQERDVKVRRLQIFNNWSPFMVADPNTLWVGMEYFCNEGDAFWALSDTEIREVAYHELVQIGFSTIDAILDGTVLRMPKAYPAYFGESYPRMTEITDRLDRIENLFLIGRNGMHRYNNQDHSMLTAMAAVENIRDGVTTKQNLWQINVEQEYHESK